MTSLFNVSDYYELLALHRAIMEAKFCDGPNDFDVSASPLVANMSRRVVAALVDQDREKKGDEAEEQWSIWLRIDPARREWQVSVNRAIAERRWNEWSLVERTTYVKDLLAPFEVDDTLMRHFLDEVDARNQGSGY
jgi:hypothetical protein